MFSLPTCLILSGILFAIGLFGILGRRNILIMLMSVEILLNSANVAFLAFARHWGANGGDAGQAFVLMNMAVAAAELAVGLALVLAVFRHRQTVDAGKLTELKE